MTRVRCNTWPEARVALLCEQLGQGKLVKDIAPMLRVSTSAAWAQVNRMRVAGDPRLPALPPRVRREPEPPRWWHAGAARAGSNGLLAASLNAQRATSIGESRA